MPIKPEDLQGVDSFEQLATLFNEKLEWPRGTWPIFAGIAPLYGLKPEDIPGVKELKAVQQLENEDWGIFLVDFAETDLRHVQLRRILNQVADRARHEHALPTWPLDNLLFIVKHGAEAFTFARFRGDKLANAKLRRFGWSDPLEARTAVENLNKLRWGDDWSEAFNVEKLTKDFFTRLSDLFYETLDVVKEQLTNEREPRLFVQTLFNRLLFLRFVEKKGWLRLSNRPDYLRALWEAGQDGLNPFWPTRLNALFNAVNHPTGEAAHKVAKPLIGDVEYLNGGLFEDDKRFHDPKLKIPEKVFEDLLGPEGLFYRYNFTVEESSPLDVQVAVDPEILGKIFEQLTISAKRHDTGSYYTPREIVQFMCREALVGYLEGKGLPADKVRILVYDHDPDDLTNKEGDLAFEALKAIKVVDPACGSGAYLLGMLQELYALFALLQRQDRRFSQDPAKEEHERKLHIIENNIYGVDLQAFATNTAMLRLWLTLLVEDTGEKPQPLPNLEYKIESGDALLGPDPSEPIDWSKTNRAQQSGLDFEDVHETVETLRVLRQKYQNAHGADKVQLKERDLEPALAELRKKVTGNSHRDPTRLDWRVEFFDVFLAPGSGSSLKSDQTHGFDVVLANPPYIDAERMTNENPVGRNQISQSYSFTKGNWDIYIAFFERGFRLLARGGVLSFITPDKWISKPFGDQLRIGTTRKLRTILKVGRDAFQSAKVDAIVSIYTGWDQDSISICEFEDGSVALRRAIHKSSLKEPFAYDWLFSESIDLLAMIDAIPTRLSSVATCESACATSDAYKLAPIIHEQPGDPSGLGPSLKIINTGTIGKYVHKWGRREMVYLGDRYLMPIVDRSLFLERFPNSYGQKAVKPKLIIKGLNLLDVCLDEVGNVIPGKTTLVVTSTKPEVLKLLLAILNSKIVFTYVKEKYLASSYNEGTTFTKDMINNLPLPTISGEDREKLIEIVQEILNLRSQDSAHDVKGYQEELDRRVNFLYLHGIEAPSYDRWLAKQEAEKVTAVEEVRNLLKIGHETIEFECKSSFAWDMRRTEQADWLRDEVHTAVCAMLNAKGGDLLIGVDDDMNVLGLNDDLARYGSRDKLIQAIENPLGKTLTPNPIGLVEIKPVDLDGQTIIRVRVKPDNTERYRFKEQIYVRRNSKSKPALTADEAASWWPKRQRGEV